MRYVKVPADAVLGRRNCSRCSAWKYLHEFPIEKRTLRSGVVIYRFRPACWTCIRAAQREKYHTDVEFREARVKYQKAYSQTSRGKKKRREAAALPHRRAKAQAEHRKRYQDPEERHKARARASKAYARKVAVRREIAARKAAQWEVFTMLVPDELEYLEMTADIPTPVFLEYLKPVLCFCASEQDESNDYTIIDGIPRDKSNKVIGLTRAEKMLQMPTRRLNGIIREESDHVALEVCDRFTMRTDYSLDDLVESAREWRVRANSP